MASAPDGPYAWGYCFVREQNPSAYCSPNPTYPCAPGKQYYGRGPMQLSWYRNSPFISLSNIFFLFFLGR